MNDILQGDFSVINIGLNKFAKDLEGVGGSVMDKNWQPPHRGKPELASALAFLADDDRGLGQKIKRANETAFQRLTESQPILKAVVPAHTVLQGMSSHTFLHAGPPIAWEKMCGAMQGAVIGGILYEKLAGTAEEAEKLAASGEIEFAPCHSRDAVGPMAGVLTPSMPVLVVENTTHNTVGYATMNEGWGRTLRFGAYDNQVIQRLDWMRDELGPMINRAVQNTGGINVKSFISRALHMGDECHNRDLAATALFYKEISPLLPQVSMEDAALERVLEFLSKHEHFFLNIAMAASKASLLAGHNIPYSTMVTAMARNGVEVGILMSGTGSRWFTGPAAIPKGLYFPGYSEKDAGPDLGDSAITETSGIGAFAMAGAPAIVRFVGGSPADAVAYTQEMYRITLGENPYFTIPTMDFRGTPTGMDARLIVETGITPVINTGIAHKNAGHGLAGAGVVRAPMEAFAGAVQYLYQYFSDEDNE